jgi:hypothetical protein
MPYTVTIVRSASGAGLRQELDDRAQRLGVTCNRLVAAIYEYAVDHQSEFNGALRDLKRPPGEHIGTGVSEEVSRKLTVWAKTREVPRGVHCKYLLEKALEMNLPDKILDAGHH